MQSVSKTSKAKVQTAVSNIGSVEECPMIEISYKIVSLWPMGFPVYSSAYNPFPNIFPGISHCSRPPSVVI